MSGIGVILNPHSKQHKKNPAMLRRMSFVVGDKASCKATEDLSDLRRVAEEFKTRDIDILAISGGDGTNHRTLTSFIQVYGEKPLPKIAFLRGGTLNTIAASLGIFGSPDTLLSDLVIRYHEDLPFTHRRVTLMKINDSYGFIFGIGLVHNFMAAYYEGGKASPLKAGITLAHAVGSALINGTFAQTLFRRFDARVSINGTPWPYRQYASIYTGSVASIGFRSKPFYLVDQEPPCFHAVGISLPPRQILAYVPAMFLGTSSHCPNLLESAAKEMTIELDAPIPHQIDGDMREPTAHYTVTQGPILDVLIP